MLEILVLLAPLVVLLAAAHKKGGRKRYGRIVVVRVHLEFPLSTLADNTVLTTSLFADSVEGNSLYMISADLLISFRGITAGEGPIIFGCAHDDYSVTEIKQWQEADTLDLSDTTAFEQSHRLIREWGSSSGIGTDEVLNNGNIKRYKMRIRCELGHNISFWAMNLSGVNPLTTGQNIVVTGKAYLRRT